MRQNEPKRNNQPPCRSPYSAILSIMVYTLLCDMHGMCVYKTNIIIRNPTHTVLAENREICIRSLFYTYIFSVFRTLCNFLLKWNLMVYAADKRKNRYAESACREPPSAETPSSGEFISSYFLLMGHNIAKKGVKWIYTQW